MNRSLLKQLKGNTPEKIIEKLRKEWVVPLEELVQELEAETTKYIKTDRLILKVLEKNKI
jgi:hypothetical protein